MCVTQKILCIWQLDNLMLLIHGSLGGKSILSVEQQYKTIKKKKNNKPLRPNSKFFYLKNSIKQELLSEIEVVRACLWILIKFSENKNSEMHFQT